MTDNYNDYINAVKKDDFIKKLLISNNTYRTLCAGFLLILIIKGVKELVNYFNLQMGIIYTIVIIFGKTIISILNRLHRLLVIRLVKRMKIPTPKKV